MGLLVDGMKKINSITKPLCRDFTTLAEERLIKIANEVDDSDDWFAQNVKDRFGRWLVKKGWLEFILDSNDYQKLVIDCYNMNFKAVEMIFDNCRELDSSYGQKIATHNGQAEVALLLLGDLAERINPESTQFDAPVDYRIEWFSAEWIRKDNENLKIDDLRSELDIYFNQHQPYKYSDEDIEYFCNQSDSAEVFSDYSNYIFRRT